MSSKLKPATPGKGTINMSTGPEERVTGKALLPVFSPESLQEPSWGNVWAGLSELAKKGPQHHQASGKDVAWAKYWTSSKTVGGRQVFPFLSLSCPTSNSQKKGTS